MTHNENWPDPPPVGVVIAIRPWSHEENVAHFTESLAHHVGDSFEHLALTDLWQATDTRNEFVQALSGAGDWGWDFANYVGEAFELGGIEAGLDMWDHRDEVTLQRELDEFGVDATAADLNRATPA